MGSVPARRTFYGILGGDRLRGPMHLAGEIRLINFIGGVELDLSQATIDGGDLTVRVISIMGGSTIHVPDEFQVDSSGFTFIGGDDVAAPARPPQPDAPVVRLRVFNVMGGNDVFRAPAAA
jgi:hypothetical protein